MTRVAFLGDLLKNTSHFVWNATLERTEDITIKELAFFMRVHTKLVLAHQTCVGQLKLA